MKQTCRVLLILVFVVLGLYPAWAQSSTPNAGEKTTFTPKILPDVPSPSSGSPQWIRDLRRGEIVAFGSFPFTLFLSTFAMDSVRFFTNDMNRAYLPWPLKGPGAIEMSRDEKKLTLMIAAASSITIALVDFAIVSVKRNREAQREQNRNGDIRINRSPLDTASEESVREEP
ncbi:MAG: hypothetical protein LBU00_07070 [Treponema sp.]|jgi:hypothetical protein|nr:hypothetical protein [Treponema sp.]